MPCILGLRASSLAVNKVMSKRILAVDDDASVRESLGKVLVQSGYTVDLATNGAEAEQLLKAGGFDLLILDLNMPDKDGWDVLALTTTEFPLMPVILITGMFDQLDSTMIPGISVLMKKPIDVPPLLEKVEELLAQTLEQRMSLAARRRENEPRLRVG
jgi:Response regulator containing CheY-like receiver, AAA-type ATPase, and DNA-binding domains